MNSTLALTTHTVPTPSIPLTRPMSKPAQHSLRLVLGILVVCICAFARPSKRLPTPDLTPKPSPTPSGAAGLCQFGPCGTGDIQTAVQTSDHVASSRYS